MITFYCIWPFDLENIKRYAWSTFSSRVLVETFGKMWTRRNTHECKHSHSCVGIVDNEQDIRDILVSFDSGLIYRHVSDRFETRREQVESVEDETKVPFTLSFLSYLVLSRQECKPGIMTRLVTKLQSCDLDMLWFLRYSFWYTYFQFYA